jgi:hypothetical protein
MLQADSMIRHAPHQVDLWSTDPVARLTAARAQTRAARLALTQDLTTTSPVRPWPYGMPTVVNPWVVVVGVSPGDSAVAIDRTLDTQSAYYEAPTFGVPHPGFNYADTRYYWDKVRQLCCAIVRSYSPLMSWADCLALSGHLNLSTGRAGRATNARIDPATTTWVGDLLGARLRPRVVIGVGLGSVVADADFKRAWGRSALPIDWARPVVEMPLEGYAYRFRMWECETDRGQPLTLMLWPNHPSRHPFAGRPGPEWSNAIRQGMALLQHTAV